MQTNKQLLPVVNSAHYTEKCETCGSPARTEIMADEKSGVEWLQFCLNPRCINFDHSNLKGKREALEKAMRKTKSFRRNKWKAFKKGVTGQSDNVVVAPAQ